MSATTLPAVPARRRMVLAAALAAAGGLAIAALLRHAGTDAVLAALARAAGWIPVLLALEALRIGCDAGAALALARRGGGGCEPGAVLRAQLIAYPVAAFTPAGRATAEAVKAAILARWLGGPRAAAIGTVNQSLMLIVTGAVSVPCAAAAFALTGGSLLTSLMGVHALATAAAGLGLQLGARRIGGAWLSRRFARAGRAADQYRRELEAFPILPGAPIAFFVVHRALQIAEYAVLLAAVGIPGGLARALVANGIYSVASAAGDLVPGQLGATDGAFTLAAPALGGTAASAMAIALLVHMLQLAWAVLGALASLVWPPPPVARAGPEGASPARATT